VSVKKLITLAVLSLFFLPACSQQAGPEVSSTTPSTKIDSDYVENLIKPGSILTEDM
jgi:hypothetical protein